MVRTDTKKSDTLSVSSGQHDHDRCLTAALQKAEEICNRKGVRFTDARRQIFQIIWQSRYPIGAYDILEEISKEHGRKAPPSVYRAINFLLEHGLIHRLESLSAFIGCSRLGEQHTGLFLICTDCGKSVELQDKTLIDSLQQVTKKESFESFQEIIEVKGRCADCRENHAP